MNTPTRVDLHNHTTRCNHATGTISEYIERAIELGIDIFGFSEHAPMDFDPEYRLAFEEMDAYIADVKQAQDQYKEHISIILGFEVDWLKGHMSEQVLNAKVDYLIGSVHFLDKWGFDNPEFLSGWKNRDIDEIWQEYFEAVEAMANSKKFDIVGHLDLIKVFKFMPQKDLRLLAHNALKAIKKADMVLEINTSGLRKPTAEIYPSRQLLEEAYTLDIPITFSSDAHAVAQVGANYEEASRLAREVGYTHAATFHAREREMVIF